MPEIVFSIRLTSDDWDEVMHGWRCPALNVPGAVVEAIYVEGSRVDTARYEVLTQNTLIRWVTSDQPPRVVASIKLTEALSLGKETERWKRLAIILPVVATLIAATITAAATYFAKMPDIHTSDTSMLTPAGNPGGVKIPEKGGGPPINVIADENTRFSNALGIELNRIYLSRFKDDDASRYFGFHQKEGATDLDINVSLTRSDTDVQPIISIYSGNGTRLFSRWHENTDGSSIKWTRPLTPGDYVIEVKPNGASGNFTQFLLSLSPR